MKKILSILMCLALMLGSTAMAATELNGGETRNIQINKAGLNEREEGISPVTGRYLDDVFEDEYQTGFLGQAVSGRYLPILVQIDNWDGGIGYSPKDGKAHGKAAPWGVQYTDVIYETPLYKAGNTRLTFLFSDIIPDSVGPIRSARMFHAKLREEWDCAFVFWGTQLYSKTNVTKFMKETGATQKANKLLLFSFSQHNAGQNYFFQNTNTVQDAVHQKSGNLAAMISLIPTDFEPANHTWLFTDDLPEEGDDAEIIYVNWAKAGTEQSMYNSFLEWDEDDECYRRYMTDRNGKEHIYQSAIEDGNSVEVTFNNIIVQFTKMEWVRTDAPNPEVLGTGNADYFMGGKHMTGVWQRDNLEDRTVFYGADGQEIELQRGRTLIIVMDYETENRSISYE